MEHRGDGGVETESRGLALIRRCASVWRRERCCISGRANGIRASAAALGAELSTGARMGCRSGRTWI